MNSIRDVFYLNMLSVSESVLWNSVVITHSKEPLENPLTTLPSEELESKALQLFKVHDIVFFLYPFVQNIF